MAWQGTVAPSPPAWSPRRVVLGVSLVLAVYLACHAGATSGGFTWLDHGDIVAGRVPLTLSDLSRTFGSPFGGTTFYRPIVALSLSLDHALWGDSPAGYHSTNLALGALVVVATFLLLCTFFELPTGAALLGTLVVAVHPLTWLPVGAISLRPELLVSAFAYLSLAAYVRARTAHRLPILAAPLFYVALLCKETALLWLPLLYVSWEALHLGAEDGESSSRRRWRRSLQAIALMFVVSILYLAQRWLVLPGGWHLSGRDLGWPAAVGTRLVALGHRLRDLVAIRPPSLSDVTTIVPLWHPVPLLVLIAILGGFVLLRLQRASESRLRLVLFLAIALLPALNLLPLPRFSSQHYSFFALPAVGAMAAYYGLWLRARPAGHLVTLAAALLGLWILTAAATNLVASYRFRDDLTLFGPEVERDPRYLEGWYYIGLSLYDRGDIEPAAAALERALASDPRTIAYVDVQSAEINLALCRLEQNRLKEADDLLLSATGRGRSRDRAALIAFNRAVVAYRGGDTELARKRLAPLVEGTEGDLPDLFEAARRTLAGGAQAAPGTR